MSPCKFWKKKYSTVAPMSAVHNDILAYAIVEWCAGYICVGGRGGGGASSANCMYSISRTIAIGYGMVPRALGYDSYREPSPRSLSRTSARATMP